MKLSDFQQAAYDIAEDARKLVEILDGCPNGATRYALALHFPVETIDYAAALCLVKVNYRVVSGFEIVHYEAIR